MKEIEKYVTVHTSCKGKEVRRDGMAPIGICHMLDEMGILTPGG